MKLCEEYKRLKDYEKMLRQQFKIDLKTLKAMSKKADELKMKKVKDNEQVYRTIDNEYYKRADANDKERKCFVQRTNE